MYANIHMDLFINIFSMFVVVKDRNGYADRYVCIVNEYVSINNFELFEKNFIHNLS